MNPATVNQAGVPGVSGDTVQGFLLSANIKSNAPQQFNIPVQVKGGGVERQGVRADDTSPYLGVFNR